MSDPYRNYATRADEPAYVGNIRGHGPVNTCPMCGAKNPDHIKWTMGVLARVLWIDSTVVLGRYCSPRRRRHGFLWARRCRLPGTHAHQHCRTCGSRWITMARD